MCPMALPSFSTSLTKQEPSRLASNEPGFFVLERVLKHALIPTGITDICSCSKNLTFASRMPYSAFI